MTCIFVVNELLDKTAFLFQQYDDSLRLSDGITKNLIYQSSEDHLVPMIVLHALYTLKMLHVSFKFRQPLSHVVQSWSLYHKTFSDMQYLKITWGFSV